MRIHGWVPPEKKKLMALKADEKAELSRWLQTEISCRHFTLEQRTLAWQRFNEFAKTAHHPEFKGESLEDRLAQIVAQIGAMEGRR